MAKVMVVDDAYSELQVMETILRSVGHDVLTYLDGEQLEEKIVKERPDVVLLDIVMPKRNGFEVTIPRVLSSEQRSRYSRHLLIPEVGEEGQLKLLDSRILLIGAGGLGSPASLYLAAAGVGTLGIVDDDVVDETDRAVGPGSDTEEDA